MPRVVVVVAVGLSLVVSRSAQANEDEMVVGVAGGATLLAKAAPVSATATRTTVRVEAGLRLGARSAAKLRVDAFRFDGTELQVSVSAEWRAIEHVGVVGLAGIAGSDTSALGGVVGAGAFGRYPVGSAVHARVEAIGVVAQRSDFKGVRIGITAGLEWRWP